MGIFGFGHKNQTKEQSPTLARTTVKDPVCGMDVTQETAAASSEYQGKTFYFCSPGCKKTFDANPGKYAGASGATAGHSSMHHT